MAPIHVPPHPTLSLQRRASNGVVGVTGLSSLRALSLYLYRYQMPMIITRDSPFFQSIFLDKSRMLARDPLSNLSLNVLIFEIASADTIDEKMSIPRNDRDAEAKEVPSSR